MTLSSNAQSPADNLPPKVRTAKVCSITFDSDGPPITIYAYKKLRMCFATYDGNFLQADHSACLGIIDAFCFSTTEDPWRLE